MPIQVQCPTCNRQASVPDNALGRSVRCGCGQQFIVSAPQPDPAKASSSGDDLLALQPLPSGQSANTNTGPEAPHFDNRLRASRLTRMSGDEAEPRSNSTLYVGIAASVAIVILVVAGVNMLRGSGTGEAQPQTASVAPAAPKPAAAPSGDSAVEAERMKREQQAAAEAKRKADADKADADKARQAAEERKRQDEKRALGSDHPKSTESAVSGQANAKQAKEQPKKTAEAETPAQNQPEAASVTPPTKTKEFCEKCNNTGVIETYEVSDKAYTIEAAAEIKAREMNDDDASIALARLGRSSGSIIGKPVWVAYPRNDGNFGIRRMTPTSSKYCDCAAGMAARKRDEDDAKADAAKCPRCKGRGKIMFQKVVDDEIEVAWSAMPNFMWRAAVCPDCGGTGLGGEEGKAAAVAFKERLAEEAKASVQRLTDDIAKNEQAQKDASATVERLKTQRKEYERLRMEAVRNLSQASSSAQIAKYEADEKKYRVLISNVGDQMPGLEALQNEGAKLKRKLEAQVAQCRQLTGKDRAFTPASSSETGAPAQPQKRDAKWLMGMASQYVNNGDMDGAAKCYKRVVDEYPDAPEAKEARQLLGEK